jgi:hypothetical protein
MHCKQIKKRRRKKSAQCGECHTFGHSSVVRPEGAAEGAELEPRNENDQNHEAEK